MKSRAVALKAYPKGEPTEDDFELVDDHADADFVLDATGFTIGGVAPVGHPSPVTTLVDVSLSRYRHVWAAAGHSHTVFRTTYEELLRVTAGHAIEVA